MNNFLFNFLKQTTESFDSLESEDYMIDYDELFIIVDTKKLKSKVLLNYKTRKELAYVDFENIQVSSFEQLSEELIEILKTPFFLNWMKKKSVNVNTFTIHLTNSIIDRRGFKGIFGCELVKVHNGSFDFDYYRFEISTISELASYIISNYHHLQIKDNRLKASCLIAATYKSKENMCSHFGIDRKMLENENMDYYPIRGHITVIDSNQRMVNVVLSIGSFQEALKILNALSIINAEIKAEQDGKVDIIKR